MNYVELVGFAAASLTTFAFLPQAIKIHKTQSTKDISLAIAEQYLPVGLDSKVPKKPFSVALSITDKIDTLVGFFGINEKPTSSKDPLALRRTALGIIRIIIENKKNLKDLCIQNKIISSLISEKEISEIFDYDFYLRFTKEQFRSLGWKIN